MALTTYCQQEIARLRAMEAAELARLRELAHEVRAAQERIMAIRGGLSAYQDLLEQFAKEAT